MELGERKFESLWALTSSVEARLAYYSRGRLHVEENIAKLGDFCGHLARVTLAIERRVHVMVLYGRVLSEHRPQCWELGVSHFLAPRRLVARGCHMSVYDVVGQKSVRRHVDARARRDDHARARAATRATSRPGVRVATPRRAPAGRRSSRYAKDKLDVDIDPIRGLCLEALSANRARQRHTPKAILYR